MAKNKHVERDVLFLERCIELLRIGGRFAIVLPYNKLGAESWGYLRKWLIERVQIVAVLGLGRNTFQPHTSQKTCVVIGVKRLKPISQFRDEEILFFISDREGKDSRGKLIFKADTNLIDCDLADAIPLVRERFNLLRK